MAESTEKTPFERDVETIVVDTTERLLARIDFAAQQHEVDSATVRRAIARFSGEDLADCWDEYAAEER